MKVRSLKKRLLRPKAWTFSAFINRGLGWEQLAQTKWSRSRQPTFVVRIADLSQVVLGTGERLVFNIQPEQDGDVLGTMLTPGTEP